MERDVWPRSKGKAVSTLFPGVSFGFLPLNRGWLGWFGKNGLQSHSSDQKVERHIYPQGACHLNSWKGQTSLYEAVLPLQMSYELALQPIARSLDAIAFRVLVCVIKSEFVDHFLQVSHEWKKITIIYCRELYKKIYPFEGVYVHSEFCFVYFSITK